AQDDPARGRVEHHPRDPRPRRVDDEPAPRAPRADHDPLQPPAVGRRRARGDGVGPLGEAGRVRRPPAPAVHHPPPAPPRPARPIASGGAPPARPAKSATVAPGVAVPRNRGRVAEVMPSRSEVPVSLARSRAPLSASGGAVTWAWPAMRNVWPKPKTVTWKV